MAPLVRIISILFLTISISSQGSDTHSKIYKWTDKDGVIHYNNVPTSNSTEIEFSKPPAFRSKLEIGMTEQQVLKSAWGSPVSVRTIRTKYGKVKEWYYNPSSCLYFANGKLIAIDVLEFPEDPSQ